MSMYVHKLLRESLFAYVAFQLDAPAFRLSALPDWQLVVPKGIDWSVFEGHGE